MKYFQLCLGLCLTLLTCETLANQSPRKQALKADVQDLSYQIYSKVNQKVNRLNVQDLQDLKGALKQAKLILASAGRGGHGRIGDGRGGRGRNPDRGGGYGKIACEQDNASLYQSSFIKMKNFAYSSSGLDYSSSSASSFALQKMKEISCDEVDTFIQNAKRLRTFAYSSAGLDYSSSNAKSFALSKIESFCSQYDLEGQFTQHYRFAYSSSGLDYSSSNAKAYALNKVEYQAFSCSNF